MLVVLIRLLSIVKSININFIIYKFLDQYIHPYMVIYFYGSFLKHRILKKQLIANTGRALTRPLSTGTVDIIEGFLQCR